MAASTYPTSDSARDLDRLIERSKRSSGARLQSSFARGDPAPLSGLIKGGHGGEVRLKLYVSMVLLAGSMKSLDGMVNTIGNVSSPTWARILALPDPNERGARRISDAQNDLARRRLIRLERRAGRAPLVTLLHASGSGEPFVEPGTPYIRIPLNVWEHRWIWCLSGRELAVLIALVDLCGGKGREGQPQPLSALNPERYGMSEDTWRLAGKALEGYGLLATDREVVRVDLNSPRLRKRFNLNLDGLKQDAPIAVPI